MSIEELQIVRAYLIDYVRTHALTEDEFHVVVRQLRDVDRKIHHIEINKLIEAGVLERFTLEQLEARRAFQRYKQ